MPFVPMVSNAPMTPGLPRQLRSAGAAPLLVPTSGVGDRGDLHNDPETMRQLQIAAESESANVAYVDWASMIKSNLPNATLLLDNLAFGGGGGSDADCVFHHNLAFPIERGLMAVEEVASQFAYIYKADEGLTQVMGGGAKFKIPANPKEARMLDAEIGFPVWRDSEVKEYNKLNAYNVMRPINVSESNVIYRRARNSLKQMFL